MRSLETRRAQSGLQGEARGRSLPPPPLPQSPPGSACSLLILESLKFKNSAAPKSPPWPQSHLRGSYIYVFCSLRATSQQGLSNTGFVVNTVNFMSRVFLHGDKEIIAV